MPEITPHIGLKKPLASETADISVINDNMDTIDSALGDLSAVPTAAKDAAGAITELHEAIKDIDVEIPDGTITPVKLSFDPATQTELDAHTNATSVHGATNSPTASRIIIRDAAGRAKVAAPAASDDIARLDSITKTQAGLGSVDNYGTATQAEAEVGTATNKFMTPQRTKQYVDKRLLNNIIWRINAGQPEWSSDGGTTWKGAASDLSQYQNMIVGSIAPATTLTDVVNISGKKGYLDRALIYAVNANGNSLQLVITVDGVVVLNTTHAPGGSTAILTGITTSGQESIRAPGMGGAAGGNIVASIVSIPYPSGTLAALCPLPSKLFFNSSIRIQAKQQHLSGQVSCEYGIATE
ncbi:hypothetical protein [Cohnella phaseoli]|uniref:Tail fiber-like repeat protein n=1 Tax=Cohnella phaseoli TaxID=456490 RepID=A0A3D9KJ72_9BACL|nr:hypothetical protein [Cohnella phaseoli]RED86222.1 hypothetical protein DFP98_10374 [Cohnella phaseoli]